LNNYVIDIEEMPEVVKANSLEEAIKLAHQYIGIRKLEKEEFEVYEVVE
jgi:hypothetical protein